MMTVGAMIFPWLNKIPNTYNECPMVLRGVDGWFNVRNIQPILCKEDNARRQFIAAFEVQSPINLRMSLICLLALSEWLKVQRMFTNTASLSLTKLLNCLSAAQRIFCLTSHYGKHPSQSK
jgi:hypothetical protein